MQYNLLIPIDSVVLCYRHIKYHIEIDGKIDVSTIGSDLNLENKRFVN